MKALLMTVMFSLGILTVFDSCKKVNESEEMLPRRGTGAARLSGYIVDPISNNQMLTMVLSGSGGYVCTTDDGDVNMPKYTPPRLDRYGMLYFQTQEDYENYFEALEIIEEHWDYPPDPDNGEEDLPSDFYSGDEPLDLIDSALGFQSLRSLYEELEFQDADFEDTVSIYVEDDENTYVMNRGHEVRIGCSYYKFITSDFLAQVSNCDASALQLLRDYGISASGHSNVQIIDQSTGNSIAAKATEVLGCQHLTFYATHKLATSTPLASNTTWEVELRLTTYYSISSSSFREIIAVDYQIDWGDGTSSLEQVTNAQDGHTVKHTYTDNFAPGLEVLKNITVVATIKYANGAVTGDCPDAVGRSFTEKVSVKFFNPNTCFVGRHVKKAWSNEFSVSGSQYKMKCKLKQKTESFLERHSKIKASVSLFKRKGGKWKKIQPLDRLGVEILGTVYEPFYPTTTPPTCASFIKTLHETKTIRNGKKVKIKDHFRQWALIATGLVDPHRLKGNYFFTAGGQQYTATFTLAP